MLSIRLNPLKTLHHELKAILYDIGIKIQITDFTKAAELAGVVEKVESTLSVFKNYAGIIESKVYPAINDYEPALVAILRDDFNSNAWQTERLAQYLSTHNQGFNSLKHILFGAGLLQHFQEFTEHCTYQMNDHATMINRVLWRYYSDEELLRLSAALVALSADCFTIAVQSFNYSYPRTAVSNRGSAPYAADESANYSMLMI